MSTDAAQQSDLEGEPTDMEMGVEDAPEQAENEGPDTTDSIPSLDPDEFSVTGSDEAEEAVGSPDEYDPSAMSVGRMWCNMMGMGAATMSVSFGDTSIDERKDKADEFSELARDMEIDRCVDLWAEESGMGRNMDPMQGAIMLSLLFCLSVAVQEPDAASEVSRRVQTKLSRFGQ